MIRVPLIAFLATFVWGCAASPGKTSRRARSGASGPAKLGYKDHLAEFLVDASREGSDPIAIARAAWTEHGRRLGYLVQETFFPHLDAVGRDETTFAVLDGWAGAWQELLQTMRRIQISYEPVVQRTGRSFRRAFGILPEAEVHLAFIPDMRRYATSQVFGSSTVLVNAARLGGADQTVGRVSIVHALFELLRREAKQPAPTTTGECLCEEALALRAAALVYPTMEEHGWAGLPDNGEDSTPPSLSKQDHAALHRAWTKPDPGRLAGKENRPWLALQLANLAWFAEKDAQGLLSQPLSPCVEAGEKLVGQGAGKP